MAEFNDYPDGGAGLPLGSRGVLAPTVPQPPSNLDTLELEDRRLHVFTLGGLDQFLPLWSRFQGVAAQRPVTFWITPESAPYTASLGILLGADVRYTGNDIDAWVLSRPGDPELPEGAGWISCQLRAHLRANLPLTDWYPDLPATPLTLPAVEMGASPYVLLALDGELPDLQTAPEQHHAWYQLIRYLEVTVAPVRILLTDNSLDVGSLLLTALERGGSASRHSGHFWRPATRALLNAVAGARLVVGPPGPAVTLAGAYGRPLLATQGPAVSGRGAPPTPEALLPELAAGRALVSLGFPARPRALEPLPENPLPDQNPWRAAELPARPQPDRGDILVLIPTAGRDPEGLELCLTRLEQAAEGVQTHVVVVVCPADPDALAAVSRVTGDRAELLALPGPFNFCRSINQGLRQRRPEDGYALFLNDDCLFEAPGALAQLKTTLRAQGWAQIGPWINGRVMFEREEDRQNGPVRQDRPLVGACVLWELAWIDRIGPLDEAFGLGYGLDEADYTLRAIRRGAVGGRDERVTVSHHYHKTFGDQYVAMENPARRINNQTFRHKYGPETGFWGASEHWAPLPGVHVAIAGHNVANWLDRCFESVEQALDGFRYFITYADDGSTDWSVDIAREWQQKSQADQFLIQTFPKGKGAGEAKNRAIHMGQPFAAQYPALCLMDADDVMAPERIRHLLWRARDGGHRMVHGSHELVAVFEPSVHHRVYGPCADYQQFQGWVHPCATVIHHSLIPEDGRLFNEDLTICEDAHRFLLWYLQGIRSVAMPGPVCHYYLRRDGSVMQSAGAQERQAEYDALRRRILQEFLAAG